MDEEANLPKRKSHLGIYFIIIIVIIALIIAFFIGKPKPKESLTSLNAEDLIMTKFFLCEKKCIDISDNTNRFICDDNCTKIFFKGYSALSYGNDDSAFISKLSNINKITRACYSQCSEDLSCEKRCLKDY